MVKHLPRSPAVASGAERSASASGAARRRREEGAPSVWDRNVALLEQGRIPERARRWTVVRAQSFVEAMRSQCLRELTPVETPAEAPEETSVEIKAFFPRYAREQPLTDWQYRQGVEAVRLLLVRFGGRRAALAVEGDFWVEVGLTKGGHRGALAADQPTRMGTVMPAEVVFGNPSRQQCDCGSR